VVPDYLYANESRVIIGSSTAILFCFIDILVLAQQLPACRCGAFWRLLVFGYTISQGESNSFFERPSSERRAVVSRGHIVLIVANDGG
jgi:hypothetical protein